MSVNAAQISGLDRGYMTEDVDPDADTLLEINGKLNILDEDAGEAAFIPQMLRGEIGKFAMDSEGHWYFTIYNAAAEVQSLSSGETLTSKQVISSVDGSKHVITFSITGVNDAALISGDSAGLVTEDGALLADTFISTEGKLNIIDIDSGQAEFVSSLTRGSYGQMLIEHTGDWIYVANNTQPSIQRLSSTQTLTDHFGVSSLDGSSHVIEITITGVNDAAVISGGDSATLTEDADLLDDSFLSASGKLEINDPDSGQSAFISGISRGDYGHLLINKTGEWLYVADNNQQVIQSLMTTESLTETLLASSIDGTGHEIVIKINGRDDSDLSAADIVWDAPVERTDGTAISASEIAGFRVYYGTLPGQYIHSIDLNDGTIRSYTFTDMGTDSIYYTVITCYDQDGRESSYSAEHVVHR